MKDRPRPLMNGIRNSGRLTRYRDPAANVIGTMSSAPNIGQDWRVRIPNTTAIATKGVPINAQYPQSADGGRQLIAAETRTPVLAV